MAGLERGFASHITVEHDEVVKTSLTHYGSFEEAMAVAENLRGYAQELERQPIRVAQLHEAEAIKAHDGGYQLRHTYELIDGPSLKGMHESGQRQEVVSQILSQIALMDTLDGVDVLRVPIDARAANFHADEKGPALTDLFPVLRRHPDDSFPMSEFRPDQQKSTLWPYVMGTKSGVMTKLLFTSVVRSDSPASKLSDLLSTSKDWCYDALPVDTNPVVRDKVGRQVATFFLPYMLRVVNNQLRTKLPSPKQQRY